MKQSYITVTDQFCGAGGSSLGASKAIANKGGEIKLALNHWKMAIETHNTNFPDTIHECTDISACDPRRYPTTDILITSPECTNHSVSNGKKRVKAQLDLFDQGILDPAAERSRATMWDVPRFSEVHKYNIVIVENVVDARSWVQFPAWLMSMHLLGYMHKCVYINSMHCHPTPQSRDRMYVVFWKKGNKFPDLEFRPLAHCPACGKDVEAVQVWKNPDKKFGKYKKQYNYHCPEHGIIIEPYYYASFNVVDWSNLGNRIGDRKKPLSINTQKRIQYGLDKYDVDPFIFHAAYGDQARGVVRHITDPAFTQTTLDSQSICTPFIINDQNSTGLDCRVKTLNDPLQTVTGSPSFKLVSPFIIKQEHKESFSNFRTMKQALQTQTTRQSMMLINPYIIEMTNNGECKPATNPTNTITAGGINHGMMSFFQTYNGNSVYNSPKEPISTVTTKDRHSLITYTKPKIEDCYYRMLKPFEVQRAMAFDDNYIIVGDSKAKVKQLGNAVTPPAMEWLVNRCVQSLEN